MTNNLFPQTIITAAQASQHITEVRASVTLSQGALESGYWQHTPPDSLNFFGLKWYQGCPYSYVICSTQEVMGGKPITIQSKFIKFPNIAACFEYHGQLLSDPRGPYASALPFINDPVKFIQAISKSYASDPAYADKLITIINQYDLTKYDQSDSMIV